MRPPGRRLVSDICGVIAGVAVTCWFLAFAYADWLRFSSPAAPDPRTGQVVYEKAVKGVFYITEAQAFWVQTALVPIWLVLAAAIVVSIITGVKDRAEGRKPGPAALAVGWTWTAALVALFFFGDHVMSLIFTGSLTPPGR